MHKTIQIRIRKQQILASIRVHSWFPLKKQSQFSSYCVLRDAYCGNEFVKTKPIYPKRGRASGRQGPAMLFEVFEFSDEFGGQIDIGVAVLEGRFDVTELG